MKLPPARIDAFIAKPDPAIRAVLVHGPDGGLVRTRGLALARALAPDPDDPFRVARLDGDALAADPARLFDEAAAPAFGGGLRLVRVRHATDALAETLGKLLNDPPPGDWMVVVEAGELSARSRLRILAETHADAVSLACYAEEGAARQRAVATALEKQGMRAPLETMTLLLSLLPADRMALDSELDKLTLYAHGQTSLSPDDVRAALGDGGDAAMDDLVMAVADGDAGRAAALLDRLYAEQVSPVALLRAAQRHSIRLQRARAAMDSGMSAEEAIKSLRPPVFWKHVAPMTRQVSRWSLPRLAALVRRLYEAEADTKRTGAPAETLCAQLLLRAAAGG